ncbi:helix-turn-helix domain-containing protein [Zhongshania sp.]|uniref:helix-turn-helix domain-containing protein n=1 Tax=Zhongshania sp. TaxID=1971902 RepID=UPI0039E511C1
MFKAVVDCGRLNQASQMGHQSEPTIHHAVHKSEESLGLPLLKVPARKGVLPQRASTVCQ